MTHKYINRMNQVLVTCCSDYDSRKDKIENTEIALGLLSKFDETVKEIPADEARLATRVAQNLAQKLLSNRYEFLTSEEEVKKLYSILPDPFVLGPMINDGLPLKSSPSDIMRCQIALGLGGMIRPSWIRGSDLGRKETGNFQRVLSLLDNYLSVGEDYLRSQTPLMIDGQMSMADIVLPYLEAQMSVDPESCVSYICNQPLFEGIKTGMQLDEHDPINIILIKLMADNPSSEKISALMSVSPDRLHSISNNSYLKSRLRAESIIGRLSIPKILPQLFFNKEDIREMFVQVMLDGDLNHTQYRRFSSAYKMVGGKSLIEDIETNPCDTYLEMVRDFGLFKESLKGCDSYEDFYQFKTKDLTNHAKGMIDLNSIRYKNNSMQDDDLNDRYHAFYIAYFTPRGRRDTLREIDGPISARIWIEAAKVGDLRGTDYVNIKLNHFLSDALKDLSHDDYSLISGRNGSIPCLRGVKWKDKQIKRTLVSEDLGL